MKTLFNPPRRGPLAAAPVLAFAMLASAPTFAADCSQAEQRASAVNDAWLEGKVETVYILNRHLNPFKIDADVRCGHVSLYGAVESDIDRDLAGELAENVDGVTSVDNQLVVDKGQSGAGEFADRAKRGAKTFAQRVEDATITAMVKSQLVMNNNTEAMDINVDTLRGIVSLQGVVDSNQKKQLAGAIAENTRGVADVRNKLQVRDS